MGYASISGRARTNARNPQAHAICDRCGARYNHVDLRWQVDWAGIGLINKRILVCRTCYDTPQEQLRAAIIPADPTPIVNARIEYFSQYETDTRTTSIPSLYANIMAISGDGSTVTVTFNGNATYPIGYNVTVWGAIPSAYNGTYLVTASSASSISFASAVTATYTGGGVVAAQRDPVTSILAPTGAARITEQNNTRVTQETGEPPYGLNQQPGTSPIVPDAAGGDNPGVPYGFVADPPETTTDIPETGPL